jgi:hypothetical protein
MFKQYSKSVNIFLIILSIIFSGCSSSSEKMIKNNNVSAATEVKKTPNQLSVGIGLSGISDWSTQFPFLNHFKSSRKWVTQCIKSDPDCPKKWTTNEPQLLDLDENGWVKSLPKPEDTALFTRVTTVIGNSQEFPQGKYIVLYDGEGKIEYSWSGKKLDSESKQGRDVINVDSSKKNGILMTITSTDPNKTGNYIRNIRVIEEKNEGLFNQGEIFNPLFLEKIKPFSTLRFMDWMETNNSQQKEWQNRPTSNISTYTGNGVSVETMVSLANKLKKDVWFNMPHQATDEYITQFAQFAKNSLDPNLKIYVEFSNEVWNWQFEQANYALAQGKARWNQEGNVYLQWYGMRNAQMCDLWNNVFADQKNRVICVMSTQTAFMGLEKNVLDCPLWVKEGNKPCYQHGISAYAITGYFGGGLGNPENQSVIESWLNDSDGGFSKAIAQLKTGNIIQGKRKDSVKDIYDLFVYHSQVAQERGLKLVAYEGGQHIVGKKEVKNNKELTNFFIELNRRPEMYDLYTELLNNWEKAGGSLFMHFNDISQPSQHGSWGSLEYLQQKESPKYNALINFIKNKTEKIK